MPSPFYRIVYGALRKLFRIFASACGTLRPSGEATKDNFAEALSVRGITIDSHRLTYHIRLTELAGVLCSGRLSPMHATYALAEQKVKRTPLPDRDEMLCRLARKYFQSHSSATFDDWQWWSGLSATECRTAIDALGAELRHERGGGNYGFYIHASCRTRGFRRGTSLLLPPFDEYLIGYKSRALVLSPEHAHHAHTNNGIFFPIVAHDGLVCATWHPWQKSLATDTFMPVGNNVRVEKLWQNFHKMTDG